MCFALYIAVDTTLPIQLRNDKAPAFYTEGADDYRGSLPIFSKPHIYYLGSHMGCGCGFLIDEAVDTPKYRAAMQTRLQLVNFLRQVTTLGSVEMWMTWEGEEAFPPKARAHICPKDIIEGLVTFYDGQFFIVTKDDEEPKSSVD
jgi:hypothetical protein